MKQKIITTSVLAVLFSSPILAEESFSPDLNFFGYARAGMHVSPNSENGNGHPDYIKADGANGKYRLGNENDWAEFGLSSTIYQAGAQRAEVGVMIGTWHDAEGDLGDTFGMMQAWGQLYGVFGSDITSIWAGKRYGVGGLADELLDFKHWETGSGRGFGIRDIETSGDARIDFALTYLDEDYQSLNGVETGNTSGADMFSSAVVMPAVKVHNVEMFGGLVQAGVDLAFVVDDSELNNNLGSDAETMGYMFTLAHRGQFGQFDNSISLQYTGGIGVSGWSSAQIVNLEAPGESIRLFNNGTYTINDQIKIPYSLAFETVNMDISGQGDKDTFSVGIRPTYDWNSFATTMVEVGYQEARSGTFDGTNTSYKATLAQQFAFGAVPRVRFYVTYAEKDSHWIEESFGNHASERIELDSVNFGAMFEAYW